MKFKVIPFAFISCGLLVGCSASQNRGAHPTPNPSKVAPPLTVSNAVIGRDLLTIAKSTAVELHGRRMAFYLFAAICIKPGMKLEEFRNSGWDLSWLPEGEIRWLHGISGQVPLKAPIIGAIICIRPRLGDFSTIYLRLPKSEPNHDIGSYLRGNRDDAVLGSMTIQEVAISISDPCESHVIESMKH